MNLRKLIQEEISRVFNEADVNPLDDTLKNIDTELTNDIDNMNTIIKTQQLDIKNKDNQIKANLQLKSKLDATSPQRKGLEVQIPQDQKDWTKRKQQLKDLENSQKGMEAAKKELEQQKADIDNQSTTSKTGKSSTQSILPSLPSAI